MVIRIQDRATSFHKTLALWALALCKWSAKDSVVVGSPCAGRLDGASSGAVGCFADLLMYYIHVQESFSAVDFLCAVRRVAADVDANRRVPFGEIVQMAGEAQSEDESRHPLFQALLTWQPKGGWERFFEIDSAHRGKHGILVPSFNQALAVACQFWAVLARRLPDWLSWRFGLLHPLDMSLSLRLAIESQGIGLGSASSLQRR